MREVSSDGFSETSSCLFAAAKVVSSGVPLAARPCDGTSHTNASPHFFSQRLCRYTLKLQMCATEYTREFPLSDRQRSSVSSPRSNNRVVFLSLFIFSHEKDSARVSEEKISREPGRRRMPHVCKETLGKTPPSIERLPGSRSANTQLAEMISVHIKIREKAVSGCTKLGSSSKRRELRTSGSLREAI